MWNALKGESRPIGGPTLAEGIAVKNVGALTLPIVRALVSDVLLVEEAHLERAVNAFLTLQKTMAEGAGAAGLAALLAKPERFAGRKVGLILCGGNIDPRILASIMVRELERENRIVSFRLTIPDRPGVLGVIATRLGELGANILEVDHRRLFLDVPAKGAKLDVTVETRDAAHAAGDRAGARRRRLSAAAHRRRRHDGVKPTVAGSGRRKTAPRSTRSAAPGRPAAGAAAADRCASGRRRSASACAAAAARSRQWTAPNFRPLPRSAARYRAPSRARQGALSAGAGAGAGSAAGGFIGSQRSAIAPFGGGNSSRADLLDAACAGSLPGSAAGVDSAVTWLGAGGGVLAGCASAVPIGVGATVGAGGTTGLAFARGERHRRRRDGDARRFDIGADEPDDAPERAEHGKDRAAEHQHLRADRRAPDFRFVLKRHRNQRPDDTTPGNIIR